MTLGRTLFAIDSHTAGEPTRIVVGGIPRIPGRSMAEKQEYFKSNFDYLRGALMREPRGHKDMFGALLVEPANNKADFGVLFMSCTTHNYMCGHASIGIAKVAVETGLVDVVEPVTKVTLDTPSGLVESYVGVEHNSVKSVTVRNVPSFIYKSTTIDVPEIGEIPIDIAFGGIFHAIVSSEDIRIRVKPENIQKLREAGDQIRRAVSTQIKTVHPERSYINETKDVRIYDKPMHPKADAKVVVITGEGQVDRSPCGTGTCAHMAMLFSKGKIGLNEKITHESIIGSLLEGKLIARTKVGKHDAVIPEITGNAYITGICTFILDPEDPMKYGFLVE